MNRKVGKVSWNSPALNTNNNNRDDDKKKIPFLNMKGNNKSWKGRVVSEDPLRYWCHFATDKNGESAKVNCTLDDTCPVRIEKTKTVCAGQQAEARFYVKWLDRSDGAIKVLDVGKQIVNGIGQLVENPDWGHCKGYDVTISKGAEGAMPLYTVAPSPHKPLTDEETQLIANSEDPDHPDFIDLESRIQPLTADVINKILKGDDSSQGKKPTATSSSKSSNVAPLKTPKKEDAKDEDFSVSWDD